MSITEECNYIETLCKQNRLESLITALWAQGGSNIWAPVRISAESRKQFKDPCACTHTLGDARDLCHMTGWPSPPPVTCNCEVIFLRCTGTV